MRIYTRTGDAGQTAVIGGRLEKDHTRVETYGTVDELNSLIGMTITYLEPERDADMLQDLADIQQNLFDCCSDLATLKPELREYRIHEKHVKQLEQQIDYYDEQTKDIEYFIIPGGSPCSSMFHVCRTIARRAERRVVTLEREAESTNPIVKQYLNRLSDVLFVMARVANARSGLSDVYYTRSKKAFRKKSKGGE